MGHTCVAYFDYESLTLKRTTVEELNGICMSMKSGNAPGYDDISMYVIKNTFELVSDGTS